LYCTVLYCTLLLTFHRHISEQFHELAMNSMTKGQKTQVAPTVSSFLRFCEVKNIQTIVDAGRETVYKLYRAAKEGNKEIIPQLRDYLKPITPAHVREFLMVKWSPDSEWRDHLLGVDLRENSGGAAKRRKAASGPEQQEDEDQGEHGPERGRFSDSFAVVKSNVGDLWRVCDMYGRYSECVCSPAAQCP
jgi:hypothetical protein